MGFDKSEQIVWFKCGGWKRVRFSRLVVSIYGLRVYKQTHNSLHSDISRFSGAVANDERSLILTLAPRHVRDINGSQLAVHYNGSPSLALTPTRRPVKGRPASLTFCISKGRISSLGHEAKRPRMWRPGDPLCRIRFPSCVATL